MGVFIDEEGRFLGKLPIQWQQALRTLYLEYRETGIGKNKLLKKIHLRKMTSFKNVCSAEIKTVNNKNLYEDNVQRRHIFFKITNLNLQ